MSQEISKLLYHGSNMVVEHPIIKPKLRALDFGAGFYLTSSRNQAQRWSRAVTKRRRKGQPTLNKYEFSKDNIGALDVLFFETANGEWLDFVVANRKGIVFQKQYDIVIGPVANDSTLPVIDDYMDGRYTRDEAIARLMPQNLTDQYAFLTDKSLKLLSFKGVE